MSEIMRAVLEKSCKMSRPCWLASQIQYTPQAGLTVSGVLKNEQNSHRLLTGFNIALYEYNSVGGSSAYFPLIATSLTSLMTSSITLRNLANNRAYLDTPLPAILTAQNMFGTYDFPFYIYLAPGDRLGWTVTDTDSTQFGGSNLTTITWNFAGIEYLMPDGR